MRRILLGSAVAVTAFAVVPTVAANAATCSEGSIYRSAGLKAQVIPVGAAQAGDGTIYIDDRDIVSDDGGGLWIYQESNDQGWLQRGGATLDGDPSGVEPCPDSDFPDQIIF